MSVDERNTVLLIESTIGDALVTKANFTAKLHTNGQRETRIRNQVCEIITSFLP